MAHKFQQARSVSARNWPSAERSNNSRAFKCEGGKGRKGKGKVKLDFACPEN